MGSVCSAYTQSTRGDVCEESPSPEVSVSAPAPPAPPPSESPIDQRRAFAIFRCVFSPLSSNPPRKLRHSGTSSQPESVAVQEVLARDHKRIVRSRDCRPYGAPRRLKPCVRGRAVAVAWRVREL